MPDRTVETEYTGEGTRCEGWRRKGGIMTLGNPEWRQCQGQAVVNLTVKQGKEKKTLPSCLTCWEECEANASITVIKAAPIKP